MINAFIFILISILYSPTFPFTHKLLLLKFVWGKGWVNIKIKKTIGK